MRAYHDSRELKFRYPFGAVALGGAVSISIDTWDGEPEWAELKVRVDKKEDRYYTMDRDGGHFYVTVTPKTADIHWYSFILHYPGGAVRWYGPRQGSVGGIGQMYDGQCPEYQITAYVPRAVPDWYKNAICYQIFPDRFFRGEDWRENAMKALSKPRNGTPKALVEDWNTPVSYKRMRDGRISVWEFYGGTLSGIEEKLDYLKGLGITAIYLNPIFEAVSNHRYDTGDYRKVDPMLGDEEKFASLCRAAEERGISLILDGVFNHTGCDSKYFNKFGNYPDPGACQGPASRYYNWFRFYDFPNRYECWWGNDELPDVEEHDPDFKSYIAGDTDSVVRHWLRLGAKGWRLDVADELPDDFIEDIKTAVVAEKGGEGLLMGEVWEDASNKVAYGELRRYFLGSELDCVMNYPVRYAVLYYLLGDVPAWALNETMWSLKENYPPENFNASFNLMGSHDRARVLTALGGAPRPEQLSEEQKKSYRLSDSQRGLAKGKLWLMALLQMTLPGVPCVYYGDEAGMEGYADPFNRGTYPWGREDKDCYTIYRNAINLRRAFPELAGADFSPFCFGDDVFGFYRDWEDEGIAVLVNRGSRSQEVTIDSHGEDVTDILGGTKFELRDGKVRVVLWSLGSAILHFHKRVRLGLPMERGAGILAHITSVARSADKVELRSDGEEFVNFLYKTGQKYWQLLPLNPTDEHGSPYAGPSAFAGNLDFCRFKGSTLRHMFDEFVPDKAYERFKTENAHWLEPWCSYAALKKRFGGKPFTQWPREYRRFRSGICDGDSELAAERDFQEFCQFQFDTEWHELRAYANSRGIKIIGDIPMYVSADSADVWANPEEFTVDGDGNAVFIAGVPPAWNDDGQVWGNPLYNWDVMEKDGYTWWLRRFKRMMDLYDYVRLDHFMGFESCWAIPAGKGPADGQWRFGPGIKLFKAAYDKFGPLPFLAEDLGAITPAIRALLSRCGFPGTDIMQYQFDPVYGYWPQKDKVAYSGTHDNETLVGYAANRYPNEKPVLAARRMRKNLFASSADVVILQLQDVCGLGNEARMNTPGTTGGNWRWRVKPADFREERFSDYKSAADRLLADTKESRRLDIYEGL